MNDVSIVDGYAGDFSLVASVEGQPAGTLAHVTVSALHPARLVLDFSDQHQVRTDARVLLWGHVGALALLERGYSGPLVRRLLTAAWRVREPFRCNHNGPRANTCK